MPRTSIRHQGSEGRSENYLASVSDLMSALLFVFIIALACAIIQAQSAANDAEDAQTRAEAAEAQAMTAHKQAETVRSRLVEVEERLRGNNVARAGLLMHIKETLDAKRIALNLSCRMKRVIRDVHAVSTNGLYAKLRDAVP